MENLNKFSLLIDIIRKNRFLRKKLAQWSHPLFNMIYLASSSPIPTADFQREMFKLTEDKKIELAVIAGFRECGKTSICNTSFILWALLSGQYRFIIIASQTRHQVRQHFGNIKRILESNILLRNDFGPFQTEIDEWGAFAITSQKYDVRVYAVSTEQSVRGALYKHHRPDLIVCDDIEDLNSTRTQESRERIYNWFVSEIVPLGSQHTRIFVLGNFLHEFSLVGRLMSQIENGERDGVAKRYPLIDEIGTCLWSGMYPNKESIKAKERKVGDEVTWQREYMLRFIASDDRLVLLDWLHFYDERPSKTDGSYFYTWGAVDLAISKEKTADSTAIVSAQVHCEGERLWIYILPNPTNRHLNFPEAIETMESLLDYRNENYVNKLFIESNGFQEAYYQQMLKKYSQRVAEIKTSTDKWTRLSLITKFIKDGTIIFPRKGCSQLINQLIGFGRENHDDLVDSMTMLVQSILDEHRNKRVYRTWRNIFGSSKHSTLPSATPSQPPHLRPAPIWESEKRSIKKEPVKNVVFDPLNSNGKEPPKQKMVYPGPNIAIDGPRL